MSLELLFLTKLAAAAAAASLHISSTSIPRRNVFLAVAMQAASLLDLALPGAMGQGTLVQGRRARE